MHSTSVRRTFGIHVPFVTAPTLHPKNQKQRSPRLRRQFSI